MIKVENLTKKYSRLKAVDEVSFEVQAGEIVGLLGPNGAGKTTIMRVLTCFLPSTSGDVSIGGMNISSFPKRVRNMIGYLPENNPLYEDMRVSEYLRYRAALKSVRKKDMSRDIDHAAERCRLRDVRKKIIGTLSKGYKQRVGLAAALLGNPKILILDEPTIGLDPNQIIEVRKLIKELGREHTILLSTHILPEVEMLADRILILNKGKIVASDTAANLRAQVATSPNIYVQIKAAAPEEIRDALNAIGGVTDVILDKQEDGFFGFHVKVEKETDVRTEIFRTVKSKEWDLRELHKKHVSLEDVFVHITAGD